MTNSEIEKIENFLTNLKYRRYSTGVMHIATPQWLEDLRSCIKIIEKLLEERQNDIK